MTVVNAGFTMFERSAALASPAALG